MNTAEVINILKKFKMDSAHKYGIKSLGIFGSFARNQQDEASDLDVFVSLQESDFFTLEKIKEELADVLNYALLIANKYNFDVAQIILDKIEKNAQKYPVEKAKGSAKKYNEL